MNTSQNRGAIVARHAVAALAGNSIISRLWWWWWWQHVCHSRLPRIGHRSTRCRLVAPCRLCRCMLWLGKGARSGKQVDTLIIAWAQACRGCVFNAPEMSCTRQEIKPCRASLRVIISILAVRRYGGRSARLLNGCILSYKTQKRWSYRYKLPTS